MEILSHNLANTDPKIIHDKFAKYESLDTEERYDWLHAGCPSSRICHLC